MIDVKNWKGFRIGDLFIIHPTKAYKLTNSKLLDGGGNPVVANSAYNNGIGGYSTQNPTEKGNMVTFSDTVDANTIFYQSKDFIGYPHVQGLYPTQYVNNWNEYTYQFFVSVFRKVAITKGFDYGNKFRRDIATNLIVKLPITIDGQPDWAYMESYMKKIMEESEKSLENLKKSNCDNRLIDTRSWKNYMLGNLFELVNSKAYHNKDIVKVKDENGLLYVTRSKFNNGIKCKVEKKSEYIINPAGTISFGAENADFFYQKKEYITGNKMYYINTCNISELAALFLKSVLEATFTKKFSFSNGMVPNRIRNEIISLPAMPDGQPDWTYMESYMKKVIDKSEQAISTLRAVV